MSYVLEQTKQQQVFALGQLGWPVSRIASRVGVDRATVTRYLRAAGLAVRGRGRPSESRANAAISPGVSTDPRAKPAISPMVSTDPNPAISVGEVSTDPPAPSRAPQASACEPFRERIEAALAVGRNARAIWQDLVDQVGFPGGYASVRRFVHRLRATAPPEARVIILASPGEEGQVDYGEGPMVRHPATAQYRRTRLFLLTLAYSRKAVRLLIWQSSAQTWAELHERAFRRLGGTPLTVVLDNLKEGVLTPDIYEPALNPLYRDVLAHYHVVGLPCRVGDPDRKGKVESGIGHTQRTPLQGLRFESLEQAQAYLDHWDTHWADTRIHGTTKRQVAAMFAEERPRLQPLPLEPFRYYRFGVRTVHLDGCVEVDAAYYSTPPGWIGQRVQVQWTDLHVRVLDPKTGQLLREHVRGPRGYHRIADPDRPARTPPSTLAVLARARHAGPHLHTVCTYIHEHEGAAGIRRILGVLSLAKKYGPAVVDEAAKTALELQVPTYRFLRRYLERQPAAPLTLTQIDPLIRQLTLYRDLIDRQTGDPS